MKGFKRYNHVILLACLAATAVAQQASDSTSEETLDEAVIQNERERERRASPAFGARNPDRITVSRDSDIVAQLRMYRSVREIRFSRESGARLPVTTKKVTPRVTRSAISIEGRRTLREASIQLAAGTNEDDGLPAVIPFDSRSSLINIDYLRLKNTATPTLVNVRNVIDPQTRRCEPSGGWIDDGLPFSNRFLILSNTLDECRSVLQGRHGDLLVAEGVPEKLREDLVELYDPLFVRFSSKLGSEPALIYVVWWPESPDNDMRFEMSWNRSALLVFHGPHWLDGLNPAQQEELRKTLTGEQIQRRIREVDWTGSFTTSAASYLEMLARAEQENNTRQQIARDLPVWINRCAGFLDGRPVRRGSELDVPGNDCGRLLQFVYDAVARAGSDGKKTVFDTWRQLLKDSRGARQAGVRPSVFMNSSSEGKRIVQGLTEGSLDWPKFTDELGKIGVRLNVRKTSLGVTAAVQSLEHFHDR